EADNNDELWTDMLPDKWIKDMEASNDQNTLFYVFKSLVTEKLIVWWDSD
ncbi:MAG: hypothetical protein H7X71_02370, partial [Chitinophagales bacterium]|nr:hypothetical protein [Chitinophagales bacterium]